MDYTDDELNDLSFDLALENDKRSYWKFYISLIKTKHEFIYTFFYNKDYKSKIIKIDLFIFGFTLNYAINGLFLMTTQCIMYMKVKVYLMYHINFH